MLGCSMPGLTRPASQQAALLRGAISLSGHPAWPCAVPADQLGGSRAAMLACNLESLNIMKLHGCIYFLLIWR